MRAYYFNHRHMNIDYSICNALQYRSDGLKEALVIYNVGCQWSINFLDQIKNKPYLALLDGMKIIPAVGKFHLNAHVKECFAKFSLNFVQGAGQQNREILETLWSGFNKIFYSARAMGISHRREVYDDYMRDSNWKKLVQISRCNIFSDRKLYSDII